MSNTAPVVEVQTLKSFLAERLNVSRCLKDSDHDFIFNLASPVTNSQVVGLINEYYAQNPDGLRLMEFDDRELQGRLEQNGVEIGLITVSNYIEQIFVTIATVHQTIASVPR